MFKAVVDPTAKPAVVVFGLSRMNIARMLDDDPVLLDLADLKLDPQLICITAKNADNNAAMPEGFDGIGIALSHRTLNGLLDEEPIRITTEEYVFVLFAGESEAAIEEMIRSHGFIDDKTQVRRSGYLPSETPPGRN